MQRKKKKKRKAGKFSVKMQKKLIVLFLVITLILIGLIGRLTYIEYTKGEKYEKIVLSQQKYDSRTIPYQRGDIVDTKGTVLATSIDVYNVILDCKVLNQNEDDIEATVEALAECFEDVDSAEIYKKLKDDPKSQYVVLDKQLPYETVQPFVEMQSDAKKYPNVNADAVWFEKEYIRTYPYGSLAASLIGFVSGGNVGTIGLENYYNSTLNGLNGREYGYLNTDNNFEKTVKPAKDGYTIMTTIDTNIQSVVEEKLEKFKEENTNGYKTRPGFTHAAAIVMNPQNGAIYAMANNPTFDLNNPRDLSAYFTEQEVQAYLDEHEEDIEKYLEKHKNEAKDESEKRADAENEQKMNLLNELWENFCVTHTFEPGSTVKPLTVACGMETGTVSGNETYVCDGVEMFGETEVHCVSRAGHGTETVEKSLMDSCNDALMQMSYVIGKEHFADYQDIFGFGEKTGIDLPGEERGILNTAMRPIDLATNAFGQNFNCTMIQLASAFASLINGGKYYQPYVMQKVLDSAGNTVETKEPVLLKQTVSEETSELIKSYLYRTVSEGTGGEAKVNGYSMGGKTGTAQKYPREAKNYLVSFAGYLPQENPELLIYLVIDEPNKEEQAHSNYAQQVVKEILEEILPYLNMYPDEELMPEDDTEDGDNPQGSPQDGDAGAAPEGNEPPQDPLSDDTGEGQQPREGNEPQGEGGQQPQEGNEPQGEGGQQPQEGNEPQGEGGQQPQEGNEPQGEGGQQPQEGDDPQEPAQPGDEYGDIF